MQTETTKSDKKVTFKDRTTLKSKDNQATLDRKSNLRSRPPSNKTLCRINSFQHLHFKHHKTATSKLRNKCTMQFKYCLSLSFKSLASHNSIQILLQC